ncbi:MAG: hypothetical protein PF693_11790 [Spirochaetia bacterium]|nr:hypothetical protein [Spirochaetia bacterium]
MRLVVFHYHLLPGGVTQVISSSAVAALTYLPEIDSITLVSGRNENTKNVISGIRSKLNGKIFNDPEKIQSVTIPELDYITEMNKYPNPEHIKRTLQNNFEGDLWWVHNYHLGKNPFFTDALLQAAVENPKQKIVLQIHDFPEASRFINLETLHKHVSLPIYPVLPNIKYVTINSRDRNYLTTAGIPNKMVFLLNNPVENLQNNNIENDRFIYNKIDKILSKSEPSYIKAAPLIVYPVRTIRRKNVLEAGLLAKCSTIPVNLLPTLPGVSKSEAGYSKIVDNCFKNKLIPGAPKAGLILEQEGISFQNIMNAADIIISSSVQEGFGYLFINSLQWKKPLIARKLDIIDDFSEIFSDKFSHFYNSVNIPLRNPLKKLLKMEYDKKLSNLGAFLDKKIISKLKEQESEIFKGNTIDFLYLSPIMQMEFLKELTDPGLLEETRKLNIKILEQMENMLSINSIIFNENDIKKFSLQNHAEQIWNIIFSFKNEKLMTSSSNKNINPSIISSFANFPSISLLYNPL